MRKICVITGTRAEYGLLYWLMQEILNDPVLKLQTIVTGMHLSPEFGLTYKEVEQVFSVDKKIEILLSSDTPVGISKSIGLAVISFTEAIQELSPDIVVVLGDRYEIFGAVSAAMVSRVPIAHIHGGEVTEGVIDEAIRHSITKMSQLHFTATEIYRNRVIQMGENPDRVFNVGGLGVESIRRLTLLHRKELEKSLGFRFNKRNLLITFHPATLENGTAERQFQEVLAALDGLLDTNLIFTKANSDTDGRVINSMIDDFVARNRKKSVAFTSLGQLRYLSVMQYVDGVVGNSSSGLLEAPSFRIGTINIGDRQRGRIKAESVIDCEGSREDILHAIERLYSEDFRQKLQKTINPYGDGFASRRIIEILRAVELNGLVKKSFYDLKAM